MILKYISFAKFIRVLMLCLLIFQIEITFASDFICDASITKKVLNRYQKLIKYKDKGELTTNSGGMFTFETIYIKPDDLKFIFYSPSGHGAYEKMSYIMFGTKFIRVFESEYFPTNTAERTSVRSLLQSAAGVTSGASLVIPSLLVGMFNSWTYETPINMISYF